jgi:hypothetical protein
VIEAMKAVKEAHVTSGFMDQVEKEARGIKRAMAFNADYWTSRPEMFARSFEAHIDRKLAAAGRKNTYLTQTPDSLLWPTAEQSAAMAPAFDRLLESVGAENFANAPKRQDARSVRVDRFMALLGGNTGQGPQSRLDQLEARLDAAKKCTIGTSCGSTCIPKSKECGTKQLLQSLRNLPS